jgi:hypothetical protein
MDSNVLPSCKEETFPALMQEIDCDPERMLGE